MKKLNHVLLNLQLKDPETEVILPRIETDILEVFDAAAKKQLDTIKLIIKPEVCATVMLVSGGYPGNYEKGKVIHNLEKTKDSLIFHAGTKPENGKAVTNGGRVISISSLAPTLKEALNCSYKNAAIIDYDGKYYRRDIGFDLQVYI